MTDPSQSLQRLLEMLGADPANTQRSAIRTPPFVAPSGPTGDGGAPDLSAILQALGHPGASSASSVSTPPFVAPSRPPSAPMGASPQPTVPMLAPSSPIGAPSKGIDWKALLQMVAPVVGGLATHGTSQTGFLQGMAHGQELARQHKDEQAKQDAAKREAGTRYTMGVADKLSTLEDPTDFAALRDLASQHALTEADRQQIQQMQYSPTKANRTKLKEMSDQLDALEKGGYNLDELAQAGATVQLKGGQTIPISAAVDLTRKRPTDASGMPIAKPEKVGNTEEERYVAKWAKTNNLTAATLTPEQELNARKDFRDAGRMDPKPPTVAPGGVDAQFNDLVALWQQSNPGRDVPADVRTKLRVQAKKEIGQADDRPVSVNFGGMNSLYQATDPKAIAAGIRDGSMPPDISQYGRPVQGAIATELQRNGFNLGRAQTDWKATQKHVASLNSTQQLKLNQSINALPDLLDSVDVLASKWKGGRFPILNKANLALAKGGAYGPEVASVANQLATQIADVTSDLGVVYMGGNSPTDHSLGLAAQSLKGEWDEKVLHDMVKLAKSNVTIRRNSINNTGVAGASAGNPYGGGAGPDTTGGGGTGKTYKLVNGAWVAQ